MRKNQAGFAIVELVLVVFVIGLLGVTSWTVHNKTIRKTPSKPASHSAPGPSPTPASSNHTQQNVVPPTSPTSNPSPIVQPHPSPVVKPVDYPRPTAPRNFKVTSSKGGYDLSWEASVATTAIAKYQIFYQGNLLAEPTSTSYHHSLPPPPPSCNPIYLTYYVRAVDMSGNISDPSSSVTVNYGGGC